VQHGVVCRYQRGQRGDTAFSTYSMLCTVSNCPYRPCITITASDLALKPVTASKSLSHSAPPLKSGSAPIIRRVGVCVSQFVGLFALAFCQSQWSEHPNVYRHLFPLKTMLEFLVQAVEPFSSGSSHFSYLQPTKLIDLLNIVERGVAKIISRDITKLSFTIALTRSNLRHRLQRTVCPLGNATPWLL